jgi:hypothetical protein
MIAILPSRSSLEADPFISNHSTLELDSSFKLGVLLFPLSHGAATPSRY